LRQLHNNQLTELPREIGQLGALEILDVSRDRCHSPPVSPLTAVGQQRADVGAGRAWAAVVAERASCASTPLSAWHNWRTAQLDSNRLEWLPPALDRLPATTVIYVSGCRLFHRPL